MEHQTKFSNITPSIISKFGRNLHLKPNHPVEIMKQSILSYFESLNDYDFKVFETLSPFVSTQNNFDKLLIPPDHPARSKSDTYYVNENTVLRTHTSAHQNELFTAGHKNFIVVGDVYRKDEIDRSHYPIFHQIEVIGYVGDIEDSDPQKELIKVLNGLMEFLFPNCKYRVNKDYFPFTHPSFEYEVQMEGKKDWMEICGCGVVHKQILENNGLEQDKYWALGLGLDRLCMIFTEMADIRYLWSEHPKFLNQYKDGKLVVFEPYSELEKITKDISFFIPESQIDDFEDKKKGGKKWTREIDFFQIIRDMSNDLIEEVKLKDIFYHPKKQMFTRMYRLAFSPIDPSFKDPGKFTKMCNEIMRQVSKNVSQLKLEMRS